MTKKKKMKMMKKNKENMEIVRVEKQKVKECFTCPICHNLYDCATTISECLHTFCRKCIRDKFIEEKLNACPVCKADLGVFPLDKLRLDHMLEDMRRKLFPPKQESVKAATQTTESSKKKEQSLSSVLATSLRISSSPDEKPDEQMEDVPQIQGSSRPILQFKRRPRKNSNPRRIATRFDLEQPQEEADVDFNIDLNIEQENGLAVAGTTEGYIQKGNNSKKDNEDVPKPMSIDNRSDNAVTVELVMTQNGKENHELLLTSGGNTEQVPAEKLEEPVVEVKHKNVRSSRKKKERMPIDLNINTVFVSSDGDTEEAFVEKQKKKGKKKQEHVHSFGKNSGEKPKGNEYSPPTLRPRRWRPINSAATPQDPDPVEAETQVEASNNPVWFSLIAYGSQNTDTPLPQISPRYLRLANGNVPVSYVKKYLVKKLNLYEEDEVEIWLRHEPVCSTQTLNNLVDWWSQTTPISERKCATVGSSAADFVMVLFYSRSHIYI